MSEGEPTKEIVERGVSEARRVCCITCEHYWLQGGQQWARCMFAGFEAPLEQVRGFLAGPESNCPAGKWTNLQPVDIAAQRDKAQEKRGRRQVMMLGPVLEVAWAGLADSVISERIEALVNEALLTADAGGLICDEITGENEA